MAGKPSIIVDAGNDAVSTHKPPQTLVGVSGSNFPPGSAVNIKVDPGHHRGVAQVRPDGAFEFSLSIRPQLKCETPVSATVHGADGIAVTETDNVFCPGDSG